MGKEPLVMGEYYSHINRVWIRGDIFMDISNLKCFILSVKEFNTIESIGSIWKV